MNERIELGDLAEDEVSGFKGVVICRSEWLAGCTRLTLQPQNTYTGKDGEVKPAENSCFDEGHLILVNAGEVKPRYEVTKVLGGDQPQQLRAVDVVR